MQVSENRSQLTSEGEDLDLDELVYLAEDTLLLDSLDSFTAPVVEALDQKAEKFGGESIGEVKKAPKGGRKPRKKDPKNAERCRQQREKRKQEKTLELKDNLRLKRERNEFLESIAELELEVQALRGQNAVDLAKENELLKFELEKHKQYVQQVLELTKKPPLPPENEKIRLLRSGCESGAGQVVGLMYSSMVDDTWKEGKEQVFRMGLRVRFWYQFLPTGSDESTAKRVNVRCDILNVPAHWEKVYNIFKRVTFDVEYAVRMQALENPMLQNCTYDEVVPTIVLPEGWNVTCTRLAAPKENPTIEAVFASSAKEVDLYPSAYAYETRDNDPLKACKTKVIAEITTSMDLDGSGQKQTDDLRRINATCFGYVFRMLDDENCSSFSYVVSTPLSEDIFTMLNSSGKLVTETGELTDETMAILDHDFKMIEKALGEEETL